MRKATKKRLLWVVAIAVTLPVAAIGVAVAYFMIEQGRIDRRADYAHRITFDPPGWRSLSETADDVLWPKRLRMIDDLVTRKLLDGLRREDVGSLLGPRDVGVYLVVGGLVSSVRPLFRLMLLSEVWGWGVGSELAAAVVGILAGGLLIARARPIANVLERYAAI